MKFRSTVSCTRPATTTSTDIGGNTLGSNRSAVTFEAAFVPPYQSSEIVDGVLRQMTVTKPTLYVDHRAGNSGAHAAGAIVSGDLITVGSDPGWRVEGDPASGVHPFTGRSVPMVIELRREVG